MNFGFFLDEVETRTGAQQARVGVSQSFPWPGLLSDREDAAAMAARAAWRQFEAASDLTRVEIVFRSGGVYMDLDYELSPHALNGLDSYGGGFGIRLTRGHEVFCNSLFGGAITGSCGGPTAHTQPVKRETLRLGVDLLRFWARNASLRVLQVEAPREKQRQLRSISTPPESVIRVAVRVGAMYRTESTPRSP